MRDPEQVRRDDLRAQITRIVEGESASDRVEDLMTLVEHVVQAERRRRGETEQALAGADARIAQLEREIAGRGWDLDRFPQPELGDPWADEG